jgi:hypothetical protein
MVLRLGTAVTLALACTALGACSPLPKSPAEFRQSVRQGGWATRIDQKTVGRDWQAAFTDIGRNAERCFNVSTQAVAGQYGQPRLFQYRTTVKRNSDTGEVSVQMDSSNFAGDVPEGGMYIMVADVGGGSAGSTRVVVYSAGKSQLAQSVMAWAEGGGGECPDIRS